MGGYVFGFIGAVVLPVSTVGSIVLFVLGDLSVALEIFFAGLIIGLPAIVVAHLQRMSTYNVVAYGKLVGNLEKVLEKAQRLSVLKRELGSYSLDFPRVRALDERGRIFTREQLISARYGGRTSVYLHVGAKNDDLMIFIEPRGRPDIGQIREAHELVSGWLERSPAE